MDISCVVVGTDHGFQTSDTAFEALIRAIVAKQYFLQLKHIAEEYAPNLGSSIAQRVAIDASLNWYNLDMSDSEKEAAGILSQQRMRPISEPKVAYRVSSDAKREESWVKKIIDSGSESTTLAICGFCHFDAFTTMLRDAGCAVDQYAFLQSLPEIHSLSDSEVLKRHKESQHGVLIPEV